MIIQVRGTSGSGKTTVVREVMKHFRWHPFYTEKRKKPLWYHCDGLYVLGHYGESACGGCDTIGSAPQVFEVIQSLPRDSNVLCEGLLVSEDVKWASQLHDLHIVFLTTPLEVCLERIRARRIAAGNTKPLNEKNTSNRVAVIERARVKLTEQGAYCRRCSSRQAPNLILKWLEKSNG